MKDSNMMRNVHNVHISHITRARDEKQGYKVILTPILMIMSTLCYGLLSILCLLTKPMTYLMRLVTDTKVMVVSI